MLERFGSECPKDPLRVPFALSLGGPLALRFTVPLVASLHPSLQGGASCNVDWQSLCAVFRMMCSIQEASMI